MTTSILFTQLLKNLEVLLKHAGFVRSRRTFRISRSGNVGLIDFQKSIKSSTESAVFTINVGVWSDRLARFAPSSTKSEPPDISDCHWRERIGFLMPNRDDKWWPLESTGDIEAIRVEIVQLLENVAIPYVLAHISDATLRDEWLNGNAPGLTMVQRLMYLTVLLKDLGPSERLESVLNELKQESQGKATEGVVLRHLQRLGIE